MAETDTKDLSIDEILASIRNILQETNGETVSTAADDDVFELSPDMILGGKSEAESAAAADIAPVEDKPVAVADFAPVEDKPAVEAEPVSELPLVSQAAAAEASIGAFAPEPETKICKPAEPLRQEPATPRQETAGRMIKSFARLFEEQNTAAVSAVNSADAGRLLEEIVKNAVADKINDCLLNAAVKEKIVPVLDSWLKLYLPEIVRQEVERVMVKVGKR